MLALDYPSLSIVVAGALVAGFITGLAGFGTGLVASGFWFAALPASVVPPLIVMASIAGQVVGVVRLRKSFAWRRVLPYLIPGCIGVPIGVLVLSRSSPELLRLTVGLFLVSYALFQLSGLARLSIGSAGGRRADGIVGLAGGFLAGYAGLPGPLPLVWLQLRGGPNALQRAIFQPFNLVMLILAGIGMIFGGQIDRSVVEIALVCVPFTLIGAAIGSRISLSISEALFKKTVLALLLTSGSILSVQSLLAITG